MYFKLVYGDIAEMNVDCIVNASNGIGYMGGKKCINQLNRGVAESIQFHSAGAVEREAKINCRENNRFGCYTPGNVFVTDAPNLPSSYVLHAVTMRLPGSKSKSSTVEKLIHLIFHEVIKLNLNSIAIPLLGSGTGGLDKMSVYHKIVSYDNILHNDTNIKDCKTTVYIVCNDKQFFDTLNKDSYPVKYINSVIDLHNDMRNQLAEINPTIKDLFQTCIPLLDEEMFKPEICDKLANSPIIKEVLSNLCKKSNIDKVLCYLAKFNFDYSSYVYIPYNYGSYEYHFYSRKQNNAFSVYYNVENDVCSFFYTTNDYRMITTDDINVAIFNNNHTEFFGMN